MSAQVDVTANCIAIGSSVSEGVHVGGGTCTNEL